MTAAARSHVNWLLAAGALLLLVLACFPEGLSGDKAIDRATLIPYQDAAHDGPWPPPVPLFDGSPEFLYQPWDRFMLQTIRQGELPLWLASNGCGAPLFANGQAAPFDPLKWVWLAWGKVTGQPAAWFLASRFWLGALGMLLLVRRLGLSATGGVLAGASYMFSGFWLYHVSFADTGPLVVLPWMLWAAEGMVVRRGVREIAALGGLIGLAGLVGHPETALFAALAAALVVLVGSRGRALGALALAGGLGVLVAGLAVVPFLGFVRESESYLFDRAHSIFGGFDDAWGFTNGIKLVKGHLFSPEARDDVGHFNVFVGTLPLLLLPFGWGRSAVNRHGLALVAIAAAAYLLFPPTAPFEWLPAAPNSYYTSPLVCLALALWGAAGLDRLRADPRWCALAAVWALALAGVAWHDWHLVPIHQPVPYQVFIGVALLGAGVLAIAATRRIRGWAPLLVLAACVQLGLATRLALPPSKPFDYPMTGALRFLHDHAAEGRMAGEAPRADTHLLYGVEGYEKLDAFINRRFASFNRALHERDTLASNWVELRHDFRPALLDLANVRYVVAKKAELIAACRRAGYPLVLDDGHVKVFENPRALPRAWVAYAAEWLPAKDVEAGLAARPQVYRNRVALEDAVRKSEGIALPFTPARVKTRTTNSVTVTYEASRPGHLVLAETFANGWRAELDGKPTPLLPANLAFRAVATPAGRHEVRFVYAPHEVAWGLGLSALGVLLCLGSLLARRQRSV